MIMLLAGAAFAATQRHDTAVLLSAGQINGLTELLNNTTDYIVSKMAPDQPPAMVNRSIFEYGNLARVLLAAHRINGREDLLKVGLTWCDGFVAAQKSIKTARGEDGGYWDTGYREVFIADTGTAVTALALCVKLQPDASKLVVYRKAMERYATFVTGGCSTPPTDPHVTNITGATGCPPIDGQGWVITNGVDKGALGDGWYKQELNSGAYTISTATTGSCAFVEMDQLGLHVLPSSQVNLAETATNAIDWLLDSRTPDGRIPYIIHPTDKTSVVFQPITYSTESMIDCGLHYSALKDKLMSLKSTVAWLVANQNADGSWGKWDLEGTSSFTPSGDAQRSPRALSLLQWYIATYGADSTVTTAIKKFVDFLLNPEKTKAFGVNTNSSGGVLVTGFVGLAVADLLQPWVTFGSWTNN